MAKQFVICQQDTYKKESGHLKKFEDDLISFSKTVRCKICYITHDKETDLHIHCILILDDNFTKKQILKSFPFADVQKQLGSNSQAFDYLTHKNDKDKTQYDVKDIKLVGWDPNGFELDRWLEFNKSEFDSSDESEVLSKITDSILIGVLKTPIDVIKVYKGTALKYYKNITNLCYELYPYENGLLDIGV